MKKLRFGGPDNPIRSRGTTCKEIVRKPVFRIKLPEFVPVPVQAGGKSNQVFVLQLFAGQQGKESKVNIWSDLLVARI